MMKWVGIPYGFDDDPGKSLDCWALCRHYGKEALGIDFPTFLYDRKNFDEEAYIEAGRIHIANERTMGKSWQPVSSLTPGDILLIKMRGHPCHCGIYVGLIDGQPSFLHTLKGRNSSIESLHYWKQAIDGKYRYSPSRAESPGY